MIQSVFQVPNLPKKNFMASKIIFIILFSPCFPFYFLCNKTQHFETNLEMQLRYIKCYPVVLKKYKTSNFIHETFRKTYGQYITRSAAIIRYLFQHELFKKLQRIHFKFHKMGEYFFIFHNLNFYIPPFTSTNTFYDHNQSNADSLR